MLERKSNSVSKTAIFVLVFMLGLTGSALGQLSSGVPANFGIEADLYADTIEYDFDILGDGHGTDDWFNNRDGAGFEGVGVIDTSGWAAFRALILPGGAAANRTFVRRMAYPYASVVNGHILLDAVYARDGHSRAGALDSSMFTQRDKNIDNPLTWDLGVGNVPDKNDIVDAYAHIRRDGDQPTDDLWLVTAMSTNVSNGAAHNDFEVFRTLDTLLSGSDMFNGPDSGHTAWKVVGGVLEPGDIIFSIDFERGGTNPVPSIRLWIRDGDQAAISVANPAIQFSGVFDGGGDDAGPFGYAELVVPAGAAFARANGIPTDPVDSTLAAPWGHTEGPQADFHDYVLELQLAETGLDLTALGLDPGTNGDPCVNLFGYVLFKTRSSQSFDASLKDYVGPFAFGQVIDVILDLDSTDVTCYGYDDGEVTATFSDGIDPYRIRIDGGAWVDPATSPHTFTGLAAGPHTVIVEDAVGCGDTTSITVVQPPDVVLSLDSTDVSCYGYFDGEVEATFSGGTPPYRVRIDGGAWVDPATSPHSFTGLAAGSYTVDVLDANDCEETATISVYQPPDVVLSLDSTDVSCYGYFDGEVEATFSGGTPPYRVRIDGGAWVDPATSPHSFTGLAAGSYTVDVLDANDCEETATISVYQPPDVVLSLDSTDVSCYGYFDGEVEATFSGGTPPYRVRIDGGAWVDPATSPHSFTGLAAGSYTVDVLDANDCEETATISVYQPPDVVLSLDSTDVSCYGYFDGEVEATFSGGTPPYRVRIDGGAWVDPATSPHSFTGLAAGSYTVDVLDANDCEETATISVYQPPDVVLSLDSTDVSCYGYFDGEVEATFSGGTPPYRVRIDGGAWVDPATSPHSFTGLAAGSYTVDVLDANDCEETATISVYQPPDVVLSLDSTDVSCYGYFDGEVEATFSGGTPPYRVRIDGGAWVDPATSPHSFTGLAAGSYTVDVLDANDCEETATISVYQPPDVVLSLDSTDVSCYGYFDGEVEATFSGGTPPYRVRIDGGAWVDPATSPHSFTGLAAGSYTVDVLDANDCEETATISVYQPPDVVLSLDSTDVSCYGYFDGEVEATFSGGTPPYRVRIDGGAWVDPATSPHSFTGLAAGSYTVDVLDANDCEETATISVYQPPDVVLSLDSTDVSCYGYFDGEVEATFSGGTPPYRVRIDGGAWVDPATSPHSFTGLAAGSYTVDVLDANDCEETATISVYQPPDVVLSLDSTDVSCYGYFDGEVEATFSGGTPPYRVRIDGGAWVDPATSPHSFTGLAAGSYTVDVLDANDCEETATISVYQPPDVVLSLDSTDVSCYGYFDGEVEATFSGGTPPYRVRIDGGAWVDPATSPHSFTGLAAGSYTVDVLDANDCEETATISVYQPPDVVLSLDSTDVSCYGYFDGEVEATFSGGTPPYRVRIDGGAWVDPATSPHSFTGLAAGSYTVDVLDANDCEETATISVYQPPDVVLSLDSTDVSCYGYFDGEVEATFSGGTPPYRVRIDGGAWVDPATSPHSFTGLAAGSYTVDVLDANDCEETATISVYQPPDVVLSLDSTDVSCYGYFDGEVEATFSGGTPPYRVRIDGGAWVDPATSPHSFTGLAAGSYTVDVLDANDCEETATISVYQPPDVVLSLDSTDVSCYGYFDGEVEATFSGGTPPYRVRIDGGAWVNGATSPHSFTGLAAGSYTVDVLDANDCEETATISVYQPPDVVLSLDSTDVSCYGYFDGEVEATFSGGTPPYRVRIDGGAWVNGATSPHSFTGLAAGSYTVDVMDDNDCEETATITVIQPPDVVLSLDSTDVTCYGYSDGEVEATFSGGTPPYRVRIDGGAWVNGATSPHSFTGLAAGSYTVDVMDDNDCEETATITVIQPPDVVLSLDSTDVSCYGYFDGEVRAIFSGGTPPYRVRIDGGAWVDPATSPHMFTGLAAGSHTVDLLDANDCDESVSITVIEPPELTCTVTPPESTICTGDQARFCVIPAGGTLPYSYSWDGPGFNSSDSCITVGDSGTYTVTVVDANLCSTDCEARLITVPCGCTFTLGGWGSDCPASQQGDRYSTQPGCIHDHFFDQVFPNGVWIGNPAAIVPTTAGATGTQTGVELMSDPAAMDQAGVESIAQSAGVAGADLDAMTPTMAPSSTLTNGWYWLHWTSSSAVKAFLRSGGGPALVLTQNLTNPESAPTTTGNWGRQILALRLNVEFTCAGIFDSVGLVTGDYCYGDFIITNECGMGKFDGMSVYTFLAIADSAVGGLDVLGNYGASYSDVNYTATCLNELFDDCDPTRGLTWSQPAGAKLSSEEAGTLPKQFSLSQNYPNPFNPECNIDYSLPTDCHVKLAVYNILGQKVRVLVDEHQSAGYRSITWDGKDTQGQELTTGVYFYRIEAGDFTESRKMVLIK